MQAERKRLHLYLAGISVPVIAATIFGAKGKPVSCTIELPAHETLEMIRARTYVHLFYLEEGDNPDPLPPPPNGTRYADVKDPPYKWKLAFMGEVFSLSETKSPSAVHMSLECLDFTNHWDTSYQYYMDVLGLNGYVARFLGAGQKTFGNLMKSHVGVATAIIRRGADEGPRYAALGTTKGLLGGIIRLMESVGGVQTQGTAGVNEFFTIASARAKLLEQVISDEGVTASELLGKKVFWKWLMSSLGSMGTLVSFRQVIDMLLSMIEYSVYPVVVPAKTTTNYNYTRKSPSFRAAAIALKKATDSVLGKRGKGSLSAAKKTGMGVDVPHYTAIQTVLSGYRKAYPAGIGTKRTNRADRNSARQDLAVITTDATEASDKVKKRAASLDAYLKKLSRRAAKTISGSKGENKIGTATRYISVSILPDLWFLPPPVCNVLFPEMYRSSTHKRQMMREVTRMQLTIVDELTQSHAITGNEQSAKFYAPVGPHDNWRSNRILPEEKHTGIIPRMERMSSLQAQETKVNKIKIGKLAGSAADLLKFQKRIVTYLYYKRKFESRSHTMAGPYNPNPIVGLPMIAVGSSGPGGMKNDRCGLLVAMTHRLHARGEASTSYTLAYSYSPDGMDDIFGAAFDLRKKTSKATPDKNKTLPTPGGTYQEAWTTYADNRNLSEELYKSLQQTGSPGKEKGKKPSGFNVGGTWYTGVTAKNVKRVVSSPNSDAWIAVHRQGNYFDYFEKDGKSNSTSLSDAQLLKGKSGLVGSFTFTGARKTVLGAHVSVSLLQQLLMPWLDPKYHVENISKEIYQKMYGVEGAYEYFNEGKTPTTMQDVTKALRDAVPWNKEEGPGVPTYWDMVKRPVANEVDILGALVSGLDSTSNIPGGARFVRWLMAGPSIATYHVTAHWLAKKALGFHGASVAPMTWLDGLGLSDDELEPEYALGSTKRVKVSKSSDPRKEAWEAVLAYRRAVGDPDKDTIVVFGDDDES